MPNSKDIEPGRRALEQIELAADVLRAYLDGAADEQDLAEAMCLHPIQIRNMLRKDASCYLRTKTVDLAGLADLIMKSEPPSDRIVREALFGKAADRERAQVLFLPEYDEDVLWELLKELLPERDLEIVCARTGAMGAPKRTIREIAADTGCSGLRVEQIYDKAIRALRSPYAVGKLFPGLDVKIRAESKVMADALGEKMDEYADLKSKYDAMDQLGLVMEPMAREISRIEKDLGKPAQEIARDAEAGIRPVPSNDDTLVRNLIDRRAISTRLGNCLRRAGVQDIRDVAKRKPEEIAKIRNLGRLSMIELAGTIMRYAGVDRQDLIDYANAMGKPKEYKT